VTAEFNILLRSPLALATGESGEAAQFFDETETTIVRQNKMHAISAG
jgi:hypothetical protein